MSSELTTPDQEYLTFELGSEEYGIDILTVQEIRVWSPVTTIPNTPDFLKGVINLRGVIVPIVDLRLRFKYQAREYNETTVVIVLKDLVNNKTVLVGIVVDAVSDVHKVTAEQEQDAPDFGSQIDSQFIKSMATIAEKIVIFLNARRLLDVESLFH
jgi:purine-binding chemotaxis protein CheW